MPKRVRIVSDLHIGHRASVIEDLAALRPLAEGVDVLVFNGDTLELKYGDIDSSRYNAEEQKGRFLQETAKWGVETVVITGNHDPAISDTHFATLAGGTVFVTHGDGLFKEVAPWSSNVKNLRKCSAQINEHQTGSTPEELHRYLAQYKKATVEAREMDRHYNPTAWGKLKIFLHQSWPPTTPFRILNCWRQMPDRAASLVRRFNVDARFIIVGHTHNAGIWKRDDRIIINLGSYFPWPGARCVDIDGDKLAVRKIRKGRNRIQIGELVATFPLSPERARNINTSSALGEPSTG